MLNVEQAIREVAAVYQAVTGRVIEAGRSELPDAADPAAHVEQRYLQLRTIIDAPAGSAPPAASLPVWSPPADLLETEQEVRYELDVPSVSRDQLSVSIVGDALLVRGQRRPAAPPGSIRHAERPAGPFQKLLALPARARRDAITATLRDGVLSIAVPLDGAGQDNATATIDVR